MVECIGGRCRPWGKRMFIAVRKYRVRRGSGAEWTKRVQDSFVPLMRELEGFRGYYLLDGGPDVIITISLFDSADEALVSNEKAAAWVKTTSWSSHEVCQRSWWAMS